MIFKVTEQHTGSVDDAIYYEDEDVYVAAQPEKDGNIQYQYSESDVNEQEWENSQQSAEAQQEEEVKMIVKISRSHFESFDDIQSFQTYLPTFSLNYYDVSDYFKLNDVTNHFNFRIRSIFMKTAVEICFTKMKMENFCRCT